MRLKDSVLSRLQWAYDKNICHDTEQEICEIIAEQEIVSYCTADGCVSFDVNDVVLESGDY